MGFSEVPLTICDLLKENIKGAEILSLGNPYIHQPTILNTISICKENKDLILAKPAKDQALLLMINIFKASKFKILDVSPEEGADIICDLNKEISDKNLENRFDFIFDFGTQEHIFNDMNCLVNIFKMLRAGGKYLFYLPANGQIDHGFRQYSPTFFYDLCYQNRKSLSLELLELVASHRRRFSFNTLPLYRKLESSSDSIIELDTSKIYLSKDLGPFTGMAINVMNQFNGDVMIAGIIKKQSDFELRLDPLQCLYRNLNLSETCPEDSRKNKLTSANFKVFLKKLYPSLPFPAFIKFKLLHAFVSIWRRIL